LQVLLEIIPKELWFAILGEGFPEEGGVMVCCEFSRKRVG